MTFALLGHCLIAGAVNGTTSSAQDTTGAVLLVIHVAQNAGAAQVVPTDSKFNTYTGLTAIGNGSTISRIYYCLNPTVGTGHTFSDSGASMIGCAQVAWFSNDTAAVFDVESGNFTLNGFTRVNPGPLTPTVANELFVSGIAWNTTESIVLTGAGWAISDYELLIPSTAYAGALAYKVQTGSAAAEDPEWSYGGGTAAGTATIAAFKAAAGAAGTRGMPFGRGSAFGGGRVFVGPIN